MRFQYRHPKVYDFLIRFLYTNKLMTAFSTEVGRGQTVFDVAAGYGRVQKYIDQSNRYSGIDRNAAFVEYGRACGRDLLVKDIFDASAYTAADVYIVVDIIHHLKPEKLQELFDFIFQNARKKVVIIEPAFVNLENTYGALGKAVDRFFSYIDYDGINRIDRWFSNAEYDSLFQERFGSSYGKQFSLVTHRITGHHHLVTYART